MRTTDLFSGVTPFASILKHIWYRQKKGRLGSLRRVEFFWVCRDAPSFGWFQSLLREVEAAQADRRSIFLSRSYTGLILFQQPTSSGLMSTLRKKSEKTCFGTSLSTTLVPFMTP